MYGFQAPSLGWVPRLTSNFSRYKLCSQQGRQCGINRTKELSMIHNWVLRSFHPTTPYPEYVNQFPIFPLFFLYFNRLFLRAILVKWKTQSFHTPSIPTHKQLPSLSTSWNRVIHLILSMNLHLHIIIKVHGLHQGSLLVLYTLWIWANIWHVTIIIVPGQTVSLS